MADSDITKVNMHRAIHQVAKKQAAKQHRSLTNYLENLVLSDAGSTGVSDEETPNPSEMSKPLDVDLSNEVVKGTDGKFF